MLSVGHKPSPIVSLVVVAALLSCMWETTAGAAERYPHYLTIKSQVTGKFFVQRVGGKVVPTKLMIGGRTFNVSRENARFGVRVKSRDMARAVPEFGEKLALGTARLGVYRVQQLIGGDREVAQAVADRGKATAGAKSQDVSALQSAYNSVLDSEAFFFPEGQWPPGPSGSRGGWAFVGDDEEDESSGLGSGETGEGASGDIGGGDEGSDGMDEGDEWWTTLLGFILIAVIMIAPVAAVMWAMTQAVTFATVFTSFAGALGAVTATTLAVTALDTAIDLLAGKPFIQVFGSAGSSGEWGGSADGSFSY